MNRDNQPWRPVTAARLSWTDSGDPFASEFDDVYYSREDGAAESRHVFLDGNRLRQRWSAHPQACFRIGETGFGTGLNFLLTWALWRQQPQPRPRLHYVAVEKHPLQRDDLARALGNWQALAPLAHTLLAQWPDLLPGQHRLQLEDGDIILDLWWEDAADALTDLAGRGPCIDAWYLDGFAPSRNASMWQLELFAAIARASRPEASFATFTAAGHVRRGLESCGFKVTKVPGFGRKRECLQGVLQAPAPPAPPQATPWERPRERAIRSPTSALVIGAGLAGCATAAALARRGLHVTLLDAGQLAGAASGNEQGILYTRLSRRHSTLTDFALQSFTHAAGYYRHMFRNGQLLEGRDGALCGNFQQQADSAERDSLAAALQTLPQLARVVDPAEAEALLGVRPSDGGYWFPASGWLHPPAVCKALTIHPLIETQLHCGPLSLQRHGPQWHACSDAGTLAQGEVAIICTGTDATQFVGLEWLPTQAIRGQTSHIPAAAASAQLRASLCHDGYVSPAREGRHCIGATFNLGDPERQLRAQDHRQNLDKLAAALPQWREQIAAVDVETLEGRVGFRCASPDYLPIAGPVPDRDQFLQDYAALRKNARQVLPHYGSYMPDLYLNTAHGSRGLSSAPLVAQLLASQICAEPLPLSRTLERALAPARFLVRDLARGRI